MCLHYYNSVQHSLLMSEALHELLAENDKEVTCADEYHDLFE